MAALKPSEVEAFLREPWPKVALVLVHGGDEGMVAERGRAIVKTVAGSLDDPFSLVRLSGADLSGDAARLVDEALQIPMFGGRRVVWLRDLGRANVLAALEPLLAIGDLKSLVVVEAGELKKTAPLRKVFEERPSAVAIECRSDEAAQLGRLIDEEMKAAGLAIEPAARQALETLIGADRLASRGEIQKLCLYAHGKGKVTEADVAAVVGDASAFAIDEVADAVAGGDPATVDRVLRKLEASGTPAHVAGMMVVRHFHLLQRLRSDVDGGAKPDQAVAQARPPVFWTRQKAVAAQLGLWPAPRIDRALTVLDEAMLQSRRRPVLGSAVMSEALLQLARAARAARR